MVCSACGFENQPNMRYCGMCGTPLPHRPLTTPGAQSTLNLTRVPVEAGTPAPEQSSLASTTATPLPAHENAGGNGSHPVVNRPESYRPATPSWKAERPPKELVPDVSLDEYLKNFRYEPPKDAGEVTMRGDAAPSPEVEGPPHPSLAAKDSTPAAGISADASSTGPAIRANVTDQTETKPVVEPVRPSVPEDTVSRLGIEPEAPEEARIQRPRFLDINEPAKESKEPKPIMTSGTSTIVGPSFLGLSDAPHIAVEGPPAEEEQEHASHWRGWLAFAVILVFAVLGVMQWRAQAGNGPVQMIKAKLYSLRHGNVSPQSAPPDAAQTASTESGAAAQPQGQPDQQPPAANSNSSTSTPPQPSADTPQNPAVPAPTPSADKHEASPNTASPAQTGAAAQPQNAPAVASAQPPATNPAPEKTAKQNTPQASTSAQAEVTKPKRALDDTSSSSRSNQPAAGAEEMTKAKNASDAAAAAAWLWKATAKGNPEAPVQLADMYIKGNGVPRSCEQAVVLLKTAAEKDNALARNKLASMYSTGNCVARNRVEAYRWVSSALAANPDSQWAQQNRDQLWSQMTPTEQAAAQKYR